MQLPESTRTRTTIQTLLKMKNEGEKVAMLSIYDFAFSQLAEIAGIDIIIVGDSLGMTMLGYKNTLPVTMDQMICHAAATRRGSENIFISKLDSAGNFIWAKALGGTSSDFGFSIVVDASGNVYTTGRYEMTADFDPGPGIYNLNCSGFDVFVSKLDSSGSFVWARGAGGQGDDIGVSLVLNPFGYPYVTGLYNCLTTSFGSYTLTNDTTDYSFDMFIAKLDTAMTVGINETETSINSILVFPNPAGNQLAISSKHSAIKEIEIYNLLGERCLRALTPDPDKIGIVPSPAGVGSYASVDVSKLSPGMYFVKVQMEKGEVVRKIIKQ